MEVKVKLPAVSDAALFCAKCGEFQEEIDYLCDGYRYIIDAKSIMGVLSAGISRTCTVKMYTDDIHTFGRFTDSIKLWIVED